MLFLTGTNNRFRGDGIPRLPLLLGTWKGVEFAYVYVVRCLSLSRSRSPSLDFLFGTQHPFSLWPLLERNKWNRNEWNTFRKMEHSVNYVAMLLYTKYVLHVTILVEHACSPFFWLGSMSWTVPFPVSALFFWDNNNMDCGWSLFIPSD